MSRFGSRFVPNIEHEVRRQATEPIVKWRQEWVVSTGTSLDGSSSSSSASVGVKILKWVRVPDSHITFPEDQDVQAEDRISDDAAIVEAPVQSIHNAPAAPGIPAGSSLTSAGGGLGTIAPKEPPSTPAPAAPATSGVAPASAIPAHVTQSFSEPNSGTNTTGEKTPTDSAAQTPAPAATGMNQHPSSQGEAAATGSNTPQIQPQVETQLHEQPTTAPETDKETLAVLAAGAEAEQQPAGEEKKLLSTDPNASVPATKNEDEIAEASAANATGDDVEMKDA
ncbi:hypothetical protein NDA16_000839 [Ustilago loliicola]|nr:hypothetical protein NDA16_000839 [Ustilago loliicola]